MTTVTSPAARPASRLRSLDGLRGAAALLVLVHHCALLFPALAEVYFVTAAPPPLTGWQHALSYTPLHLFWAGTESVYLFFVLSGLVLVLPVLARTDFDWLAYYPRRVVRLYGPVVAAVGLGLLAYAVAPRVNRSVLGTWVNGRPNSYPLRAVLTDLTLLGGSSGRISPLWSLQWEVLFSLLLPLFVVLVAVGRRHPGVVLAGLLGLVTLGAVVGNGPLNYLPMFGLGALMAAHWASLGLVLARWSARWRPFWGATLVLAVVLTCARWELTGLGVTPQTAARCDVLPVVGVCLFVLAAGFCPGVVRLLHGPVLQWLGRISFSLYLVHEPIVLSCRFLTRSASPWLAVALAVPVALLVAVLFERLVEARFHRLAQRVGRRVQQRDRVGQPV